MKKLKLFKVLFLLTVFSLSFIACSDDNAASSLTTSKEDLLVTPTNELLAPTLDQLSKNITNGMVTEIISVNYLEVPKNINGFVAEVEYLNEDNNVQKVLILRNIPKIHYTSELAIRYSPNSQNRTDAGGGGDVYISCSGPGCCYPQGLINMETGEVSSNCKCEGDPGQNSSCTMKISSTPPGGN